MHTRSPSDDHLHDDGHYHGPIAGLVGVERRKMLYLLGAGLLGATLLPGLAAEGATSKKRTVKGPGKRATTNSRTASGAAATSIPVAVDPWTLFPNTVRATRTATELVIESTGMPEHQMMIGITNWQQQVPLPQPYSRANAWRIPLRGALAETPISAKTALFRGAIAVAVNGVPIFNALNNRGEDSFLIGKLDQWGGHCGRADDYHYHAAPLHLQSVGGAATPIAVALDGFPIYGLTEPDGSPVRPLDSLNGHADVNDTYHYHSTLTYPYINGGMRGKVQVRDGQIDPQPSATPTRPSGTPLRGASITSFTRSRSDSYSLQYRLAAAIYRIDYSVQSGTCRFTFTDPSGTARTETYQRR